MSKILALSIIAIVQVLNFPQKAEASVLANCDAAWTGSSFQWYTDCSLWVTNEPLIVGATDIRMTVNYYASLYLGSNYIGSANLWDSDEDELNITQDSGSMVNAREY